MIDIMTPARSIIAAIAAMAMMVALAADSQPSVAQRLTTDGAAADPRTGRPEVRVAQLRPSDNLWEMNYPGALPSLLTHVREQTTANIVPEPIVIRDFTDERLNQCPFVYANAADRKDWTFSPQERASLKAYLENGGFLYIDAGITASFLREHPEVAQHHSYAEWDASPEIKEAFADIFPEHRFQPLPRTDPLFRSFYQGLPDTSLLPATVRSYTEKEKFPDGTYSAAALRLHGRIAVLVTPIIAMGWAKNALGQWVTSIQFRVLESTDGLGDYLKNAAYGGPKFEVTREDQAKDIIYCQDNAMPAWANEPGNVWRVFRYYNSREISDFAHVFYTRLGTNILVYALTQ
jgi:hypothetical protein